MTGAPPWTLADAGCQDGRIAVVTGANSGIGVEISRALVGLGATVILACRNLAAAHQVQADLATGTTESVELDLADLASVRRCAEDLRVRHRRIDLLINNAGVMAPVRTETADGFESDFGVNFLGHFALTGLLHDRADRIVMVSSLTHRRGRIDFDDLQSCKKFRSVQAYADSKLAQLLFMYEFNCRHEARCVAAHPGSARTAILRDQGWQRLAYHPWLRFSTSWFVQDADAGALPIVRAATDPDAADSDFYGPGGRLQTTGAPIKIEPAASARDPLVARRLWDVAESLTGVRF